MSRGRKGRRHKPRPPRPIEQPMWGVFEGRACLHRCGEAWVHGFFVAYVARGEWKHRYFHRWRRVNSAEVFMDAWVVGEEEIVRRFGRLPALPREAFRG